MGLSTRDLRERQTSCYLRPSGLPLARPSWVLRNLWRRGERTGKRATAGQTPVLEVLRILWTLWHSLTCPRDSVRWVLSRCPPHAWKPGAHRSLGELPKASHEVRDNPEVTLTLQPMSSRPPQPPPILWFFPSLSWKAGVKLSPSVPKHKGKNFSD